jgi:hypothetical protein
LGNVLGEADCYLVSNQQGMYTEQFDSGKLFVDQGSEEPATIQVYHRRRELAADQCPPITVWQYRSVPLQSPGNVEIIATNFMPAQARHDSGSKKSDLCLLKTLPISTLSMHSLHISLRSPSFGFKRRLSAHAP